MGNPDQPVVSVIVPAFNAETTLAETLGSVIRQTLEDWECLVVDDGSTDGTAVLVEAMAERDPRIRLVRQANQGVGAARNTAIRAARGRYLAPLDADDRWEPAKLARQVERMEGAGEDCGLVYCWSRKVDVAGQRLWDCHPFEVEGHAYPLLVMRNFVGNASVPMFRRSAVEEVGLYLTRDEQDGGQGCEDWDLSLRVLARFRCAVVPDYLVDYREVDHCMSRNVAGMERSYRVVIDRVRQGDRPVSEAIIRWSEGHFYAYLMSKAYMSGDPYRVLCYIGRSVRADPVMCLYRRFYRLGSRALVKVVLGMREPPVPAPRRRAAGAVRARPAGLGFIDLIEMRRWASVSGMAPDQA